MAPELIDQDTSDAPARPFARERSAAEGGEEEEGAEEAAEHDQIAGQNEHEHGRYDTAVDVFSFGVLAWTVWTREQPYAKEVRLG
jgi:hypothetical protein